MKLSEWFKKLKESDLIDQVDVYEENDSYELEIRFDMLIGIRDSINPVNCHFIYLNSDIIEGLQRLIRDFLKELWVNILDEELTESWMCREDERHYPADKLTWCLLIEKNHHSKKVMEDLE